MPRHSRKTDPPRINLPIANIHTARREESGRGDLCLWFLRVTKNTFISDKPRISKPIVTIRIRKDWDQGDDYEVSCIHQLNVKKK